MLEPLQEGRIWPRKTSKYGKEREAVLTSQQQCTDAQQWIPKNKILEFHPFWKFGSNNNRVNNYESNGSNHKVLRCNESNNNESNNNEYNNNEYNNNEYINNESNNDEYNNNGSNNNNTRSKNSGYNVNAILSFERHQVEDRGARQLEVEW